MIKLQLSKNVHKNQNTFVSKFLVFFCKKIICQDYLALKLSFDRRYLFNHM